MPGPQGYPFDIGDRGTYRSVKHTAAVDIINQPRQLNHVSGNMPPISVRVCSISFLLALSSIGARGVRACETASSRKFALVEPLCELVVQVGIFHDGGGHGLVPEQFGLGKSAMPLLSP